MLLLQEIDTGDIFMYYYDENNILMLTWFLDDMMDWTIPSPAQYSTLEQAKKRWKNFAEVIHEE